MSKKTTVPSIEHRLTAGVDQAAHWAAPKVENALAWAERGLGEGKVRGKAAGEKTSQQLAEAIDKLSPQVQAQLERLAPLLEGARSKVEDQYVPAASARLAPVAGRASKVAHNVTFPPSLEHALVNVTGDKKAVKHLKKAAEDYARAAEKQLKKQAKKRNQGKAGKAWLVVGVVAAAGAAAVAVWQLTKPVEDPWKTPAPAPLPKQDASTGTDPDLATHAPSEPASTTAPGVVGGHATVDTAEEKVDGTPAPKSAE